MRLDEICEIKGGKRIPRGMKLTDNVTSHIYIRVTDMKDCSVDMSGLKYITDEIYDFIRNYTISANDLYITIAGSIGRVGEIPKELHNANLTENAAKLTNIICDKKFLMYALLSDIAQSHFTSRFHQVAQPKLSIETASCTLIPLPPLNEQARIVNEIDHLFATIKDIDKSTFELSSAISQVKSKILELAINGKLVPQDPADEPAVDLLKRVNPNAVVPADTSHYKFDIPNNWTISQLGSLFTHNTGKALNRSNREGTMLDYITTSNLYWDRFELEDLKQMPFKDSEIDKCTVIKGDLLVCEGGDIGRSAIWNYDYSICIQNHIHRLRPIDNHLVFPRFYYYCFLLYKHQNLIGGKGIGIQGLSSNQLHKVVFPLPPLNEQKRIVSKVDELFAIIDQIKQSLE